jgi:hypothetical protein
MTIRSRVGSASEAKILGAEAIYADIKISLYGSSDVWAFAHRPTTPISPGRTDEPEMKSFPTAIVEKL